MADQLEPPRRCPTCDGRLDVQVYPTGYRASCRRCDRVHPARDAVDIAVTRTDGTA